MIQIIIKTKIYPTEDYEKVLHAIKNVIGFKNKIPFNIYITNLTNRFLLIISTQNEIKINGSINLLNQIYKEIRKNEIVEAIRNTFIKNIDIKDSISITNININKQVAYIGKINIMNDVVSLGTIKIILVCKSQNLLQELIDWIAPKTKDGKIINQINIEHY